MQEPHAILDPDCLARHLDALYRSARGLCGSALDAEDLVQEMIARVLSKPRHVSRGDELPYLMVALRHVFYDWRRNSARRPQSAGRTEDEVDLRSLLDLPDQRAEANDVLRAVSELPPAMRDALITVDLAGFKYHEAAAMLGVSKGTVAGRVFRARARIAEQFDPTARADVPESVPGERSLQLA